ncbi:MAG: group 1 glycosyl transferase [Candidatus Gottesmanbacteria bacterium GW2011_GWA2_43_14]|uniref:Group 1 glycosyl transferase n=1 Tax=Candidatus Gottesmanbacteria bacterium GW2011_GWA2_43_14 TaxID=1618443 RepID=A0A0G1GH53_9BACT|nr:MAG: group 1 glycosyl transferase [Candidatus Gottesmanbacteria bacterium GW2011_GWA2_43_14]
MKILYFGSYDNDYIRNVINIKGLRLNLVDVIVCNFYKRKLFIASEYSKITYLIRISTSLFYRSIYLFFKGIIIIIKQKISYIIIGFPGHLDIPIGYLIAKITGSKIIFDPFISLYDTFVTDRKIFSTDSLISKSIKKYETAIYKLPDLILTHTETDKLYFSKSFKIPLNKIKVLYIGSDNLTQKTTALTGKSSDFSVVYQGNFIPLHGIEHIIHSAFILSQIDKKIKFIFVGNGQTYQENFNLANILKLRNVVFKGFVSIYDWKKTINKADIILGIFQNSVKASKSIPNKVIQGIAAKKAVITAETTAIKELFNHFENMYFCKPADPLSLANGILELKRNSNLRNKIAYNGNKIYKNKLTPISVGRELLTICNEFQNSN